MVRVLNVAEKNSVARAVSDILSNGQARGQQSCARYNPVYQFRCNVAELGPAEMVMTSVAGHLLELDFVHPYNRWNGCEARQLYDVPVAKKVNEQNEDVKKNLQQQARGCQVLVLWLDCDREGENIAFEVIEVCTAINPRLTVRRARFSALVPSDIHRAVNALVAPNEHESRAVDARQEIDLRIGSSFTRLQTLLLQNKFDWSGILDANGKVIISYGPCQFPTLGLIVQREWEIQAHISEPFWYISLWYRAPNESCEFHWARQRIYDHASAVLLHELCTEDPTATVREVDGRRRTKQAPAPLSTLEMQKRASQYLRLPGERIMKLAEELYQAGYVSYPRTETDTFDQQYDLRSMVHEQLQSPQWGGYAQRLMNNELWRWPRSGGHDDKAHPPIHPTKFFPGDNNPDKKRLYEFIVRHFLACCSLDAVGQETKVTVEVGGELFTATGLMVTERNYLDVYTYEGWGSAANLPVFQPGQQFQPASIDLKEGRTQPPPRLSERDLIAKMEEYGIGTDATVADHIQKQLDRGYAVKDGGSLQFSPTPLGQALISAYRKMGLANLWQPTLRGVIESNITAVAQGRRSKESVLQEAMDAFREDFANAQRQAHLLTQEVSTIVFGGAAPMAGGGGGGPGGGGGGGGRGEAFGACPCGAQLVLIREGEGQAVSVQCASHPICLRRLSFPASATAGVTITEETCNQCTHGPVRKLQLLFRQRALPMGHAPVQVSCVVCDRQLQALLEAINGPERRGGAPGRGASLRGGGARGGGYARGAPGAAVQRGRAAGLAVQRGGVAGSGGAPGRGRGRGSGGGQGAGSSSRGRGGSSGGRGSRGRGRGARGGRGD